MAQNLCENCKKAATVHVTEIKNGKKVEKHYCKECAAAQEGLTGNKTHQPINELLSNFVLAHSGTTKQTAQTCSHCEMTWAKFKQGGLLGCEHDYDAFESELTPLLKRAHEGATHHSGKVPARRSDGQVRKQRVSVSKLRRELQSAIDNEDYEAAARLRDEIQSAD